MLWHNIGWDDCLRILLSGEKGLKRSLALKRNRHLGPNLLRESRGASAGHIFLSQFKDFMTLVLLAATLISGLMGEYVDAISIITIVLLNAVLGFVQEFRAERAIKALSLLHVSHVSVLREGRNETVDVSCLVPGDVVFLQAGMRVPADIRLGHCLALEIDEAVLTGESVPVRKSMVIVPAELPLSERTNMAYAGTLVTRGHGKGVVVAIGMETEMGQIAKMLEETVRETTPLQNRLEQLGQYIVWVCLLVCLAVVVLGIYRGQELRLMFLAGVSLAVAAIPEGLPAIVTVALALGVQKMSKAKAIVRKLPAVETLGSASVICADKTGTLTKNEMTVRRLWLADGFIEVAGSEYEPQGAFLRHGRSFELQLVPDLALLFQIAVLCNNSLLDFSAPVGTKPTLEISQKAPVGNDPTETALLILAQKGGITRRELERTHQVLDELPFDAERKRMTVLVSDGQKGDWLYSKGAPEAILPRCSRYRDAGTIKPMTAEIRVRAEAALQMMSSAALRVLALAYRSLASSDISSDTWEEDLVFVGFLGLIDPPRPEVPAALARCQAAGIRTIMITGDHAGTAKTIATELGMLTVGQRVCTGADLDACEEREVSALVRGHNVFARVSPRHKLLIVRALKAAGDVVAMTGDGINDAPALVEADIGVAMGRIGTDVAKEAASLVLEDDNFATIVAAVREGRGIYDNIRKTIRYLLACNVGELLSVFLAMLWQLPLPLKPLQILWVNLVTDGLPAMALGLEGVDSDIMTRPPRPKGEGIFARGLGRRILMRGILIGLTTAIVFAASLWLDAPLPLARTMAFATLVFCQLFHVFDCRSETLSVWEKGLSGNPYLFLTVFFSAFLFLITLYVPRLRPIFATVPLSAQQLTLVFVASGLPTLLVIIRRRFPLRKRIRLRQENPPFE